MLTPEQMDDAGELVAAAYRQVEADLLAYLVRKMAEGDVSGQRAQTAILLLSQSMPAELARIIAGHADELDAAAVADVERALSASDAYDVALVRDVLGLELAAGALTLQTAECVAQAREMIARGNVALNEAARREFFRWSTWAITQAGTGAMAPARAMRSAVRNLVRPGLSVDWVQYQDPATGRRTVRNRVDVAVQRHMRSLIGQGAAKLTLARVEESGCGFVEVSAHFGARPSHQEWEGRVYHVGGAVDLDGVHYEDFDEATGYHGTGPHGALGDRLLGVNCRHSFGPWFPGCPRAYDGTPEHPSGLTSEEAYELSQRQRAIERAIREDKREVAAMQRLYDADPTQENQVALAKAKLALRNRQAKMRGFIRDANAKCKPGTEVLKRQPLREWAGDMPKGGLTPPQPANRTLDEFLAMPSVERARAEAGISKAQLRSGIRESLGVGKGERDGFEFRSAEQQRGALDAVLPPKNLKRSRKIPVGGVFGKEPSHIAIENISSRLIPELYIEERIVFAGAGTSNEYRKRETLVRLYGGEADRWFHSAGRAWAFDPEDGKIRRGEFHWAEEPDVGIREFRLQNWVS